MILKDGIYEAEDLFYADGGFTVKIEGGEMEFFEGAGLVNRLKTATVDPFSRLLQLGEAVSAPSGLTPERCEFDKSLVKTILSAETKSELTKRLGGMMKAMIKCSIFESTFIMTHLAEGGLVFMAQENGALVGKNPDGVKPGRARSALSRIILNSPGYVDFVKSISAKANRSDSEKRLCSQLTSAPDSLKSIWEWTEADSKECLAILASKPFFGKYLYPRSGKARK